MSVPLIGQRKCLNSHRPFLCHSLIRAWFLLQRDFHKHHNLMACRSLSPHLVHRSNHSDIHCHRRSLLPPRRKGHTEYNNHNTKKGISASTATSITISIMVIKKGAIKVISLTSEAIITDTTSYPSLCPKLANASA